MHLIKARLYLLHWAPSHFLDLNVKKIVHQVHLLRHHLLLPYVSSKRSCLQFWFILIVLAASCGRFPDSLLLRLFDLLLWFFNFGILKLIYIFWVSALTLRLFELLLKCFLPYSHDVSHFHKDLWVDIVVLLIWVDLIKRALLALMGSCFHFKKLGRLPAVALVGSHNHAIS